MDVGPLPFALQTSQHILSSPTPKLRIPPTPMSRVGFALISKISVLPSRSSQEYVKLLEFFSPAPSRQVASVMTVSLSSVATNSREAALRWVLITAS